MEVVVNSKQVSLQDGDSLAQALDRLCIDTAPGTAVAVDRKVVPRDRWAGFELTAGADIVVLKATQGG